MKNSDAGGSMKYYNRTAFILDNIYQNLCLQKSKSTKLLHQNIRDFCNRYADDLSSEAIEKLSSKNTKEIMNYLHNNNLYVEELKKQSDIDNQLILSDLPKEFADLINEYDIYRLYESIIFNNVNSRDLKVNLNRGGICEYGVIMKDAIVSYDVDIFETELIECSKEGGYYIIEVASIYNILTIKFKNIELLRCAFDYSSIGTSYDYIGEGFQWNTISNMLNELRCLANNIGEDVLSDRERYLLPLTNFQPICKYSNYKKESAELFEEYVINNNANFLLPLLNELKEINDSEDINNKRLDKISAQIYRNLLDKRCTGLFRALYNDLTMAAATHPKKENIHEDKMRDIRKIITETLYKLGFSGEYPEFRKIGSLKGFKLLENRKTYVVRNEKNMASFIKVEEYQDCKLKFLCGTIFLRQNEVDRFDKLDVYDASFLDKGRRYTQIVMDDHNVEQIAPETVATIAAKLSTMHNISRKDKASVSLTDNTSVTMRLMLLALVGSILCGICMTVGFMLIELVIALFFLWNDPDIWGLLTTTPWHLIFLGTNIPLLIVFGAIAVHVIIKKSK